MSTFTTYTTGRADARPVVLIHGFMGSAADFGDLVEVLGDEHHCVRVDLPGHGDQPLGDAELSLPDLADALRTEILDELDQPVLVGYSMGGRLALQTALDHPDAVDKLVLVSTSPGIPDEDARRERRAKDRERAAELRQDYPAFLDRWYRLPIFGELGQHSNFEAMLARRLQNDREAMARVIVELSPGRQPSNWHRLDDLDATTWLVGADDPKYAALGARLHGVGHDVGIAEHAAHALHVERPNWLAEQLEALIDVAGEPAE
jgi:2-succinyl-6-hydroxy-2,4-cyclohexadiene-1-carboxylate synthase